MTSKWPLPVRPRIPLPVCPKNLSPARLMIPSTRPKMLPSVCRRTSPFITPVKALLEVLFGMALKKLSSEAWNEEESRLLDQLDSPFIDINTTFCNLVKSILNKNGSDMDSSDLITLKLCLSRIVNLMNPKQAERVIRYLRIDDEKKQVRGSIDEFLKHSLNKDAHKAYDKILDVFETGSCLEDALIVIDALKKPLLERKERDTNMYRMLKIVEHVLGYLYACRDDDSEATVYR